MAEPTRTDKSRHTHTEMRHDTPDREWHTCPMFNILMANVGRGYTRGDTHTQMRSMAHHVRSNTPGNNLSFFVFSYFWVCHALKTLPVTSMMIPCHLSLPFSHHHHHICLPVPHHPPHALFLPTSHPRYGQWGPREQPQAPSGEFPLCSAPYLLTSHHHHLLPHHSPGERPPGQSQGMPPTLCHVGCIDSTMHTPLQMWQESAHRATANATTAPSQSPSQTQSQITTNRPWKRPQNCPSTHSNNPVPRVNPHADGISPRKCPNRWNPVLRPLNEDSVPLGEPTGDTVPTMQPGVYPTPPTNQARMTAEMPSPSATRPTLHPTWPWPLRPYVDTQMRNSAIDGEDSWWVHSGVAMLLPLLEFMYNLMYSK